MARGTQLGTLVAMLRNEIGRTDNPAASVSDKPALKRRLNAVYENLYRDFDWPHLRIKRVIPLVAGQRYYDFPSDLDYERVEEIKLWEQDIPWDIERGIETEDYVFSDPDEGDRRDPALKWDIYHTGTKEQIEIWPVPADDDNQELRLKGFLKFAALVNESDTCRLDDNLVVLFAAASILARQEDKNAPVILQEAQTLYGRLRGRTKGSPKIYRMGLASEPPESRQFVVHVS